MRVVWTPEAYQDRIDVWDSVAAVYTARQWPPVRD